LGELREAPRPMGSREIAQAIVAMTGQDARDRKFITEMTKRVSKALRILKEDGNVRAIIGNRGNLSWMLRPIV
jgi:hypothetical protein